MPTAVYSLSLDGSDLIDYTYDNLGRNSQKVTNTSDGTVSTAYTYVAGASANQTTALLQSLQNTNNNKSTTYSYDYDNDGNIKNIYENGTLTQSYVYDSLNQLTRANDFKAATATFYTYDQGGNLLTSEVYPYIDGTLSPAGTTTSYGYNSSTWKDLMTSYSGQTITYDTIGNPLQYRDGMTMTWQNVRELSAITKTGLNVAYAYNGNGIRTSKTVNGATTKFIVDGNAIVSQQGTAGSSAYDIDYLYDENGKAYGFYYNDDIYYYEFDGQGDVVSILDHHGDLAASYTYDAWGKLLSVTDSNGNAVTDANNVANLNIFRYRGYCYDTETGLYYLQSRYYDPNTGRFVNADETVNSDKNLISYNLFIYCVNNPVNNIDINGNDHEALSDQGLVDFMNQNGTNGYTFEDLYRDLKGDDNWIPDEPDLFVRKLIENGINVETDLKITLFSFDDENNEIKVENELSISGVSNDNAITTISLPDGSIKENFFGIAVECAMNGGSITVGQSEYKLHLGVKPGWFASTVTVGLTYEGENYSITDDWSLTASNAYYIAIGGAAVLAAAEGGEEVAGAEIIQLVATGIEKAA